MEWGTTLPKTWPTFLMKVLTCMEMRILGRSKAQIAILWISLLLETWVLHRLFMQTQINIAAHSTAKKLLGKYFSWAFRHVKEVDVKLKSQSLAHFSSFFQTKLTGLKKSLSFLAFITVWRRSGILSPAFSRNKTAYSFQQLATNTSVNSIWYMRSFGTCQ